jgi:hypothetical protein
MPKVDGMGKLLSLMKEGDADSGSSSSSSSKENDKKEKRDTSGARSLFTPEEWERLSNPQPGPNALSPISPLQHVKHVDNSCRQFKLKHLKAKVKALDAKKEALARARGTHDDSISSSGTSTRTDEELASTYEEEKARAIIHEMNYKFCLSQVSCPERMNRLASCWGSTGPVLIKQATEAGQEGLICLNEREGVERCSGALVQRLMRVATEV